MAKIERKEGELSQTVGWRRMGIELDDGELFLVTSVGQIDDLVRRGKLAAEDSVWIKADLAAHLRTYDIAAAKMGLPSLRRLLSRLTGELKDGAKGHVQGEST